MKYGIDDGLSGGSLNHGTIACPSCGHEFELSEALTERIRQHLKSELTEEVSHREKEIKSRLEAIAAEKQQLTRLRESIDDEVEKKLKARAGEIEARAAQKVEGRFADQLKELQAAVNEREESIKAFRANELELRRKKQDLEREKEEFELKLLRRVEEECCKVRQDAEQRILERHRLKDLEKEKLINDLKADLDDLKRKAEQGSMQVQGEVLELDFEAQLQAFFNHDKINPVPQGVLGADLIQAVLSPVGAECGSILWEIKNTKSWSNQWVRKLKDDMITARASLAILVSVALPDGVKRFSLVEGVWVTDPASALALATALRQQLIAVNCERQSQIGKNEKTELLYAYLAGPEFKQKIEAIVETFSTMHGQILKERRAMEKQWREREKLITRVLRNTTGLYGDMQGIIGGAIPCIPALELDGATVKQLTAESEDDDENC